MDVDILSLFPEFFEGPLKVSILGRAIEAGLVRIQLTNIRDFAKGVHRKVDDRPFGGGPGMVMMPEPVAKAVRHVRRPDSRVIYLSPQGMPLTAAKSQELAALPHLILLCGHYEGIDERVIESDVDEEISIGDYVLTNGALAALVLLDAMARFIPGVIGHSESTAQDSFEEGLFDHPHYTRPEEFEGKKVPPVLLQGNHAEIAKWRKNRAVEKTKQIRPDLYQAYEKLHKIGE